MLNLLLFVVCGVIAAVGWVFFFINIHKREDWKSALPLTVGVIFSIIFLIICVVWPASYTLRWNQQRDVEQFVESQTYESFLLYLNTTTDGAIIELEPMSNHIKQIYKDINQCNKVIKTHTAANENWWFDMGYPDWDAPEIIKLK